MRGRPGLDLAIPGAAPRAASEPADDHRGEPPELRMEPCGGVVTDDDLEPSIRLDPYLLTDADAPSGLTGGTPKDAGTAPGSFFASVPSIVPVAFVVFSTSTDQIAEGGTGTSSFGVQETLGEVGSAPQAAQLVRSLQHATASCTNGAPTLALPGPVPGLAAVESRGQSSAQEVAFATVVAAKGPYVMDLSWSSSLGFSTTPAPALSLTPLPGPPELASLADRALSLIPG